MAIIQSVSWWCFVPGLLGPEAFVAAAAAAGFTAIDLVPPEHSALVRAAGLRITSTQGHRLEATGLNNPAARADILAQLRSNIDHARRWDIPHLVCFSGNRYGPDDATGAAMTAETLASIAPVAEAAGVTLVLELLNSKRDHPGYQADRTAWGVSVCQQVASPAVRLLYDIYHMQVMEGDVIETIRTAAPFIAHYHTAGVPGRRDLDDQQELFYPPILRAIRETGFAGVVGHEFVPKGEPAAALRDVFAACARWLE